MKLYQQMNGYQLLGQYRTQSGVVLLGTTHKGVNTEYVVARADNGQEWTDGQYFNSLDYGTPARAHAAAKGAFLYRSGLDTTTGPKEALAKYDAELRKSGVKFILVGNHPTVEVCQGCRNGDGCYGDAETPCANMKVKA